MTYIYTLIISYICIIYTCYTVSKIRHENKILRNMIFDLGEIILTYTKPIQEKENKNIDNKQSLH